MKPNKHAGLHKMEVARSVSLREAFKGKSLSYLRVRIVDCFGRMLRGGLATLQFPSYLYKRFDVVRASNHAGLL